MRRRLNQYVDDFVAGTADHSQCISTCCRRQTLRVSAGGGRGGAEFAGPENDGPNRRVGKCRTWTLTEQYILQYNQAIGCQDL